MFHHVEERHGREGIWFDGGLLPTARGHRHLQALPGEPCIASIGLDTARRESQLTKHIHDLSAAGPQVENRFSTRQIVPKLPASLHGDARCSQSVPGLGFQGSFVVLAVLFSVVGRQGFRTGSWVIPDQSALRTQDNLKG